MGFGVWCWGLFFDLRTEEPGTAEGQVVWVRERSLKTVPDPIDVGTADSLLKDPACAAPGGHPQFSFGPRFAGAPSQ